MKPEYTPNIPQYPCQACPYLMQGQQMPMQPYMMPYMQNMVQTPFTQMPGAAVPVMEDYKEMKEEEDGNDAGYRQIPFGPTPFFPGPFFPPPFFGPRPFFPPPFFGPRPFFPPPFFGPRPFFPPPFFGPRPFFPGPGIGGFGLPFLTGLALGGLLF